jgi:hypothetical protein
MSIEKAKELIENPVPALDEKPESQNNFVQEVKCSDCGTNNPDKNLIMMPAYFVCSECFAKRQKPENEKG